MSVINQMLRDLDKRQAADPALLRAPALTVSTHKRWYWALLLLPALWLGIEIGQSGRTSPPEPEAAAELPQQPAATSVDNAVVTTAVTGETAVNTAPVGQIALSPATTSIALDSATAAPVVTTPATITPATPTPIATAETTDNVTLAAQATTVKLQAPEPVVTPADATTEIEAYALQDTDATFLAESATTIEPEAPAVKPQMTISSADPARSTQQHWRAQAQLAQASGRLAEAETAWLQLAQLQPQQTEAYEQLAQLYLQQRDWPRLSQLLARARQQQLDSAALQWANIQQFAALQQWQALLAALTPAIQQQYPQQVLALEAHAAQQTGDAERALQAYQRWSQLAPQDSRPWLGLGTMLDQRGQWPEAQQAYQQALQLGGLSPASQQFIQQRLASATGQ